MPKPEVLDVPPEEAVRHFRSKGHHFGFDWRDTDAALHVRSFTVAKAMRLDILTDIRTAVDAAIADGNTLQQFRDRLEPLLRKKGWWGQQLMTDPKTGEQRLVQLGSARRLRTIFDTNLRMSYARGRWERIERLKDRMPYLRYVAVEDSRTRPDHIRWHGAVLPVDHPFWKTHYPPNGWGCRCIVQQLSQDDLKRYGYGLSKAPPTGWNQTRPWLNKRTGQTVQVPVGIDPGFGHNVGTVDLVQQATDHLKEKIGAAPKPLAQAFSAPDLDTYITEGRRRRQELVRQATGNTRFSPERFRLELVKRLAQERGAGAVTADIKGAKVAAAVRNDIAGLFPRSWIEKANQTPLRAVAAKIDRGGYRPQWQDQPAQIQARTTNSGWLAAHWQGTRVHEYVHHLQTVMPDLNKPFVDLHRRRTKDEPLVPVTTGSNKETGRIDRYHRPYQGREYKGDPREVITMAFQDLWEKRSALSKKSHLGNVVKDDPEMLDLVLGALFKYDP